MFRVATVGVNAIKDDSGSKYVAGQSSVVMCNPRYQSFYHSLFFRNLISVISLSDINSGTSQDWAKGGAGIKYSYTLGEKLFLKD